MTLQDFLRRFPGEHKATQHGVMVKCPAHEDGKASLSVSEGSDGKILLKCFAGCGWKEITAAMGLEAKDLFVKELAPSTGFRPKPSAPAGIFGKPKAAPEKAAAGAPAQAVKPVVEASYTYTDPLGREIYRAVRYKPKSFRQCHKVGDSWVWNMDGVERVLYRLPEVLGAKEVWVVEGEKDADNLAKLGFCATTNVGGAGKWLDGYTESLAGKDVVICGDNDEPGQKHVQLVFDSVSAKARTVKLVRVPSGHKDVSDLIASNNGGSVEALKALVESAVPHVGGVRMPIYSMADLQASYHKQATMPDGLKIDLGNWLPSFRGKVRPLLPGEVLLFIGDTGIGKTLLLQNLFMAFPEVASLLFELELPQEMMFERFWAIKMGATCVEVEQEYKSNGVFPADVVMKQFPKLYICPEPRLSVEQFETLVTKSELKIGEKPKLVGIDYVQLVEGKGSRYERTSDVAEGVKVVAKATQSVVVVLSQVDRGSGRSGEVGIHSAKGSGSLENSSGVVITAERDEKDETLLTLKVVKSTKGGAGLEILCNIDGAKSKITERARVDDADVPQGGRSSAPD